MQNRILFSIFYNEIKQRKKLLVKNGGKKINRTNLINRWKEHEIACQASFLCFCAKVKSFKSSDKTVWNIQRCYMLKTKVFICEKFKFYYVLRHQVLIFLCLLPVSTAYVRIILWQRSDTFRKDNEN